MYIEKHTQCVKLLMLVTLYLVSLKNHSLYFVTRFFFFYLEFFSKWKIDRRPLMSYILPTFKESYKKELPIIGMHF